LPTPQAGEFDILDRVDGFSAMRNGLRLVAEDREDYAGIPMPLEHHRLVINPKFSAAEKLSKIGKQEREPDPDDEKIVVRNRWWSNRYRCDIYVIEIDGRIESLKVPRKTPISMMLDTMDCSVAWGIEQESKALGLLATLIPHHAFKAYLMTGMFMERSKRSGLTYMFRKLRPTVVIDARDETSGTPARILCALCLHPIAFYAETWAGAMTPTDDVVAHLMLMRGDEHMFWKRANQHPATRPEAGMI
jgi:hypothetical protein